MSDEPSGPLDERTAAALAREVPADVRLQGLIDAVVAVADGPELPALLNRIVEAAALLVNARYGALTVLGPDRAMEQFVVAGVDERTREAIGDPPVGLGLLGELVEESRPIRLHRIADHPASVGFPAGHPPMSSLLGVSVRIRDEVYGTLYLTDKRDGEDFTVDDGLLAQAFAAAAGMAIANARLTQERDRRRRWQEAFGEIRTALVSGAGDDDEALLLIAARARELTGGDAVLLLLPDSVAPAEQLVVVVADGRDAAELRGLRTPVGGSIAGRVYRSGEAMSIDDVAAAETHEPAFDDHGGYGPAVFAPIGGPGEIGVLVVAKLTGTAQLSPQASDFAVDFAGQAALALRMNEALRAQQTVAMLADRERIGRDLHDQVIQRLFATGMGLESITRQLTTPALRTKLRRAVDDLDQTVRDIRHAIFELHEHVELPQTLRQQIVAVLDAAMGPSHLNIDVRVADSVDAVVPPEVADHALAVLREAVTNVIRHAGATTLSVSVTAADRLRIEVVDDGVGFPVDGRRSGLANLADRAERLGGVLELGPSRARTGGRLVWDVPLALSAAVPAGPGT